MTQLIMALMVLTLVITCTTILLGLAAKFGYRFQQWRSMRIVAERRAREMSWLHQFEQRQKGARK